MTVVIPLHLTNTQKRKMALGGPVQVHATAKKGSKLTHVRLDKRTHSSLAKAIAKGKGKRIFGHLEESIAEAGAPCACGGGIGDIAHTLLNRVKRSTPVSTLVRATGKGFTSGPDVGKPKRAFHHSSMTLPEISTGTDRNGGDFLIRTKGIHASANFENHALQPEFNGDMDSRKQRPRGPLTVNGGGFVPIGGGFVPIGSGSRY